MRSLVVIGAVLTLSAGQALAQTSTFNFEDGTDQGFGTGFGNDASASFPVINIGGSLRMGITQSPAFQEAGRETGNPAEPFYQAMLAASANEAGYLISYDYYIDTSLNVGANGNFLQLGTFVNSGSGYYAQKFPEVAFDGGQLSSGQVLSGTVSETFASKGYDIPLGENFFRLGLILNGDGNPTVYYDNITVRPVPEPTTLAALAMGGLLVRRRRA